MSQIIAINRPIQFQRFGAFCSRFLLLEFLFFLFGFVGCFFVFEFAHGYPFFRPVSCWWLGYADDAMGFAVEAAEDVAEGRWRLQRACLCIDELDAAGGNFFVPEVFALFWEAFCCCC